jgi:hypothetical protein
MKTFIVSTICTAAMLCPNLSAAQGKGHGPKPKATTGVSAHGGGAGRGGVKTQVTSPKVQGGGKVRSTSTTGRGGAHVKTTTTTTKGPKAKSAAGATASTTTTKRTSTTAAPTSGTTLTPVQQKLQKNTNLAAKLQSRLPAGTDLTTASAGFKNLGQFVAAVNVSNNLRLDFTTLKTAMVADGMSLGQAIQSQKKSADGTTEARRAQTDADALIRSTESSTATAARKTKTRDGQR